MNYQKMPALPGSAPHLAGQRRRLGEASLQGLGFSQPAHISRLGGRFYLVDGTGEYVPVETFDPQIGPYLDCVVVDVNENRSKIYFDRSKPYDPNKTTRFFGGGRGKPGAEPVYGWR